MLVSVITMTLARQMPPQPHLHRKDPRHQPTWVISLLALTHQKVLAAQVRLAAKAVALGIAMAMETVIRDQSLVGILPEILVVIAAVVIAVAMVATAGIAVAAMAVMVVGVVTAAGAAMAAAGVVMVAMAVMAAAETVVETAVVVMVGEETAAAVAMVAAAEKNAAALLSHGIKLTAVL